MRRAPLLVSALLLAGCATDVTPSHPAFHFPRHDSPLGTGDAARLDGVAVYGDGCLWIQAADGTLYLPLWPADAQLGMINSQPAVHGPDGELLVESGDATIDNVELSGSEASLEVATELVGDIPSRCMADAIWVVGDVLNRP